jgi:hypothetical protein
MWQVVSGIGVLQVIASEAESEERDLAVTLADEGQEQEKPGNPGQAKVPLPGFEPGFPP